MLAFFNANLQLLVDKALEADAGILDSRLVGAGRYLLVMEKAQLSQSAITGAVRVSVLLESRAEAPSEYLG